MPLCLVIWHWCHVIKILTNVFLRVIQIGWSRESQERLCLKKGTLFDIQEGSRALLAKVYNAPQRCEVAR